MYMLTCGSWFCSKWVRVCIWQWWFISLLSYIPIIYKRHITEDGNWGTTYVCATCHHLQVKLLNEMVLSWITRLIIMTLRAGESSKKEFKMLWEAKFHAFPKAVLGPKNNLPRQVQLFYTTAHIFKNASTFCRWASQGIYIHIYIERVPTKNDPWQILDGFIGQEFSFC